MLGAWGTPPPPMLGGVGVRLMWDLFPLKKAKILRLFYTVYTSIYKSSYKFIRVYISQAIIS